VQNNIAIDGSTQTAFTGNTNPWGPEVVLNGVKQPSGSGIFISGDGNRVEALVINGFQQGNGVHISYGLDSDPSDNVIKGNYIGTDARGTWPVPNGGGVGINGFGSAFAQASRNIVQGNTMAGNKGNGIGLRDAADTQISGNSIGIGRGNVPMGNQGHGIVQACAGDPRTSVLNNRIAYNTGDGVRDEPDYRFGVSITPDGHQGLMIRRNSIFANGGLGINLLPAPFGTVDGVTPNDPGDADPLLQNFPVLTTVANNGATSAVAGTLNSTPNRTYVIELFANTSADPTGNGEGQSYLGFVVAVTNPSGNAGFSLDVETAKIGGKFLTATATKATTRDTSEFSQALLVP
jgi:parallel beta-helix repeat protein